MPAKGNEFTKALVENHLAMAHSLSQQLVTGSTLSECLKLIWRIL
jgi:hypothetical protein